MLTQGEDVEVHALRQRGWTVSAIARHLGRDPKTVRAYLSGQRQPGRRASSRPDLLAPFASYLSARFVDDPHLWATALFDEVVPLGYAGSYVSFARQLRLARLRPHCEACAGVSGRATIEIEHPGGEEMQWDWFERRKAPWGGTAYVLLGTLPHSSRVRGVLAESLDQPHLVEGIDAVLRRYGGTPRIWRTDRLATVIVPGRRDVQPSFVPVAKHYGVVIEPCPPRRGNRKGAVESSVRYLCGRWWRTMTASTPAEAQRSLDAFCAGPGDRCSAATGSAQQAWRSIQPPAGCWSVTGSLRPVPGRWCAPWPITPNSSAWCSRRSPPSGRVSAKPTGHRVSRPALRRRSCLLIWARRSSWTRYAELATTTATVVAAPAVTAAVTDATGVTR